MRDNNEGLMKEKKEQWWSVTAFYFMPLWLLLFLKIDFEAKKLGKIGQFYKDEEDSER